ncbi:MAG: DNA-3-methyladenine glycosylase I [Nocardioidaceae bacterium]
MTGPLTGADGVARCPWGGGDDPVYVAYHDTEWGMPVSGESAVLERLTLEAFQSGLSWRTILMKREAFRSAFAGFDADAVSAFDDADVARLMADAGIVRNGAKIRAAVTNAAATVALRVDGGLEAFVEGFRPEPGPAPVTTADIPATSPASVALSKALKKRGFAFVGPTTMYALMQAIGLVDDHLAGCHRRGCAAGGGEPPAAARGSVTMAP